MTNPDEADALRVWAAVVEEQTQICDTFAGKVWGMDEEWWVASATALRQTLRNGGYSGQERHNAELRLKLLDGIIAFRQVIGEVMQDDLISDLATDLDN